MSDPIAVLDDDVILRVSGLGKLYARSAKAVRSRMGKAAIRAFFNFGGPKIGDLRASEFWAVSQVSFELRRGEAIGIIGLNGSGKTTLLRMLAGQIVPDAGEIWIQGATAAMIDLQAGFQSSASGRENVYLRAAALGLNKAEIDKRADEIIAFTELGDAIEAPISTYSSGMKMRLAFSIMVEVAPDILFIDEVLAVGDYRFRLKCLGKIREMRDRSGFVLVSHSMADIERFCDRVLVLHRGEVHFFGPPKDAIRYYLEEIDPQSDPTGPVGLTNAVKPQLEANDQVIESVEHYWADAAGKPVESVAPGDGLRFICKINLKKEVRQLTLGIPIYSPNGTYLTGFASRETYPDGLPHKVGENAFELQVEKELFGPGVYHSNLVVRDGVEHIYRKLNPSFSVRNSAKNAYGLLWLPHSWKIGG